MKTCRVCGEEKLLEEFHWKIKAQGIRQSQCRGCACEKSARWRAENPERKAAQNREQYARTGDTQRAARVRRRKENPERHRAYDRRYYAENAAAHKAYTREWKRANRDRHRAYDFKRRSGAVTEEAVAYIAILRLDPCAYCGGSGGHVDHIEPISKGGDSEWGNLTAACPRCNSRKRTTDLLAFLARAK